MAFEIQLYPRAGRPTTAEGRAVDTVRERLAPYSRHLRRVGVRFDRSTSPRGNVDQTCRVDVTLVGVADAPKVLVEGRAPSASEAADLAADAAGGAVRREVEEAERRPSKKQRRRKLERARARVIEVRRGESASEPDAQQWEQVPEEELMRPEHLTPREVKSANPRRKRHIHKTQNQARATAARELSATRPSRKSTRKSANRSKRDSNLARRTEREVRSPEARAARSTPKVSRAGAAVR